MSPVATQQRVLVTGASGFIGRNLVARLAKAGWRVRAAARNPTAVPIQHRVEVVAHGDLAGPVDWAALVAGSSSVVHLAGLAHASAQIPETTYMAINADAVAGVATAARAAGVGRIIFMSSVRAQSGPTAAAALTEACPPQPIDAYGRAKLAGEQALATVLAGSQTSWCALRPVLVYGPGVKGNMASLLKLARLGWPLPLRGLAGRRSLLGLDNLFDAIVHLLAQPPPLARPFLLADPEPLTVPEMVSAMRRGLGRAPGLVPMPIVPARWAAHRLGKADAWQRLAGDLVVSTEALQAIGWQPVETARQGLQRWTAEIQSEPRGA